MSEATLAPTDVAAPQPGIRHGCTRREYESITAVNQSLLKEFRRSPAHARQCMLSPRAPTPAMELGTAIHCALLEPGRFAELYAVMPDFATGLCDDKGKPYASPRATNKYKAMVEEFKAGHAGRSILDAEDADKCRLIGEAVAAHETAARLLSGQGKNELGVVWLDADTGVACKGLVDRVTMHAGGVTVVDLKTTSDASERSFRRDCEALGYYLQAAFYLEGLNALAPARRRFIHVAVETEPPFGVAVYEMDPDWIADGRDELREYLRLYCECTASGHWPGYPDEVATLSRPRWAQKREAIDVD